MKPYAAVVSALVFASAMAASSQVLFRQLGPAVGGELVLCGSAQPMDESIRLTPAKRIQAGAAWLARKQDVAKGFSTMFQFRITEQGDVFPSEVTESTGGDGFAFVIQNADAKALGAPGGCLGYAGIANSVAIEFDTWDNHDSGHAFVRDVNDNHVAVHTLGTEPNSEFESYALGVSPNLPWLDDGEVHTVRIEYVPGNLYVFVDDIKTPVLAVQLFLDEVLDLDEGKAWVGFTAATWDAFENHDILDWAFTSAVE